MIFFGPREKPAAEVAKLTPEQMAAFNAGLAEQVDAFRRAAAAIARMGFVAQDFERLRQLLNRNPQSAEQGPCD